jgi:hypothetical protein
MPVEPVPAACVADDVVDGSKAVVGAADRHVEQRMAAIAVGASRAELQHLFGPDPRR